VKSEDENEDLNQLQKEAGERLKKLRMKKYPDLSVLQFSISAEVSRENVYKMEDGESDSKMSTYLKLARMYNMKPSELIAYLYE
jgi:predicted transcriptional regulator